MAAAPTASGEVRRIAFVSLGCPKNLVDSEKMLGVLRESGFQLVSDHDQADAVVVNTCGFLEASKDESLEVIQEALARKRAGTLKRVVVAGCLVQRHRARMLEWAPGIDAMIGVFDRDHIDHGINAAEHIARRFFQLFCLKIRRRPWRIFTNFKRILCRLF